MLFQVNGPKGSKKIGNTNPAYNDNYNKIIIILLIAKAHPTAKRESVGGKDAICWDRVQLM